MTYIYFLLSIILVVILVRYIVSEIISHRRAIANAFFVILKYFSGLLIGGLSIGYLGSYWGHAPKMIGTGLGATAGVYVVHNANRFKARFVTAWKETTLRDILHFLSQLPNCGILILVSGVISAYSIGLNWARATIHLWLIEIPIPIKGSIVTNRITAFGSILFLTWLYSSFTVIRNRRLNRFIAFGGAWMSMLGFIGIYIYVNLILSRKWYLNSETTYELWLLFLSGLLLYIGATCYEPITSRRKIRP